MQRNRDTKHTGTLNIFLAQTLNQGNILTCPRVALHLCLVFLQVPSLGLIELVAFLGRALLVKKEISMEALKIVRNVTA